jgi:hypothetical protein
MARGMNSKAVSLQGGTLTLKLAGNYSFEAMKNGQVKINLADGQTTILSAAQFASIETLSLATEGTNLTVTGAYLDGKDFLFSGQGSLHITGVVVAEAVIGSPVEADIDLSGINFGGTLETVNGTRTDYLKVMWDLLDDAYASGTYYNTPVNEAFIRLGLEYVDYLQDGGEPLSEFTAKASATRDQSMHDNLLGNLIVLISTAAFPARFVRSCWI